MTSVLLQGLVLSLVGMGLTFAALGLFILTILALRAIFGRPPGPRPGGAPGPTLQAAEPVGTAAGSEIEAEVAAAILVALERLRAEAVDPHLGQALEAGRGPWWSGQPTSAGAAWGLGKDRHEQH